MDAKTCEAQETMLAGHPVKVCGYGDAQKSILFDLQLCSLSKTILESSSEPWIYQTWYIDGCSCDEIIPDSMLDECSI